MLAGIFALLGNVLFFTGYVANKNSFERPLNKEKEYELLLKLKDGDEKAKEELAKHNMRLVIHIVKKYASYGDNDELVSVGNVGLAKAIKTFNLEKDTQFATYAARCIENEILMSIRSNKKYKENKSLYEPISFDKEGNDVTLIDILAEDDDSVFKDIEREFIKEKLMKILLETLTKKEYEIICLRYGLNNEIVHTQNSVAERFGISRSYVSRIETKALDKIRKYMLKNKIDL